MFTDCDALKAMSSVPGSAGHRENLGYLQHPVSIGVGGEWGSVGKGNG